MFTPPSHVCHLPERHFSSFIDVGDPAFHISYLLTNTPTKQLGAMLGFFYRPLTSRSLVSLKLSVWRTCRLFGAGILSLVTCGQTLRLTVVQAGPNSFCVTLETRMYRGFTLSRPVLA